MTSQLLGVEVPTGAVVVSRSTLPRVILGSLAVGVLTVGAVLPMFASAATTSLLVNVFILMTMATMWNLLAGYAGMVSIGQQAFIGLGAYGVVVFASGGVGAFTSVPLAAIAVAVLALPISLLVFRLRGGYFAIATWVVANTAQLVISAIPSLGGGTGTGVSGLIAIAPTTFNHRTYWVAFAVVALALAGAYGLLRSRLGLVLAAMRDNETSARSSGARIMATRRLVFVISALGCAAAGAVLAISQLTVQPSAVFSVNWSAEMIFATLIGGMGTIEGPIVGTVVFFVLQQNLSQFGAWYLIIFGAVAVLVAIYAPQGIWGLLRNATRLELFPVSYTLRGAPRTFPDPGPDLVGAVGRPVPGEPRRGRTGTPSPPGG